MQISNEVLMLGQIGELKKQNKSLQKENQILREMLLDEIEGYCEKILSDVLHYSQGTVNTAEKIRNIINKTKENK
ncbi:MAG: hypothetical protein L6V95_03520 [Candidatus Melainabacteria bacterium]|nr:MAG: hypothetical protein L6V95_03520 [Candidatus Melainabacteria bacterium]